MNNCIKCYQNILNKIKLNTVYNQLKEIIHPKVESCLHLHLLSDLYLILYYFCSTFVVLFVIFGA